MLALLLTAALVGGGHYGNPQQLFQFADARISESSGVVAGSRADGVVFTHNDSGDTARVFAVGPDGATRTVYTLPGVRARDWEDIARGPDEQGRSSLWIGDVGDNSGRRDQGVLVHRIREPLVGTGKAARTAVTTERPTEFRLRYPDGPGDAETLLVMPGTGRLYLVGKPLGGAARVYRAPERLDPGAPNALEQVAQVSPRSTGTPGGPGIGGLAQLLFTGGDVSPDGTRVALRTYTDVYEWAVPASGDLATAFAGTPVVSPLPPTRQGEGLAYDRDGTHLLTSSEGSKAPVFQLQRLPDPPAETSAAIGDGSAPRRPVLLAGTVLATLAGVLLLAVRSRRRAR